MKSLIKVSLILSLAAFTFVGCNCFKKMAKHTDRIEASANPQLLSLKGQNVAADITVAFPDKYVDKNAVIKVTPVLNFNSGKIEGTSKFIQGENVKDNYTIIPYRGGSYTQNVVFAYDERADLSTLELVFEAKCKNGEFMHLVTIPVAEGISTVQKNADWTAYMDIMPDNFKRVTTITESADIHYLVSSSVVRPGELRDDQIKLFEDFVKENIDKDRTTLGNIYAKGYASPEGPVDFNDKLSRQRSESGKAAITKQLKKVEGVNYDAAAYGEDWDGFKELVQGSSLKDKDLILQVLNMYSSPVQRDREIKNMSAVYEVLKKDVLPQLRRTQLVASADISGKTDAELVAATKGDINSLTVEEMLFAATLVNTNEEKAAIYKAAADKYDDVRAYNNYGVALAQSGKIAEAKSALEKASKKGSDAAISNNLGAVALAEGNQAEAAKYRSAMNNRTKGLLSLAEGDYASATRSLDGYNLAVAHFCNGNIAQAKTALGNTQTACADYLRAIIAMREGDTTGAQAHLNAAAAKCDKVKAKAAGDVEFKKLNN